MTREERIRWCIEQAEAIEAELPPRTHSDEYTMGHCAALAWRDLAERLELQSW